MKELSIEDIKEILRTEIRKQILHAHHVYEGTNRWEEEVANAISKDSKKDPEERETARDVLSWIKDVRKTWNKDNSLHPNAVTKLMKITAIRQGKWGWSVPGGKVPKYFRRS